MRFVWIASATAAVAAVALAQEQSVVKVGDTPKYAFSNPMVNGLGVKSLADFQGRPLMVEFWGTM
jgi:hypothetical protein